MSNVLQFSINNIHEVTTENSAEFCYARICVLSTRPNSHQVLITDEILRRDGLSVRGKWIVCDYNGFDATTHTDKEKIVGIVPHNAEVEFIEEDGYTSMYVDAIISKIYAKEIYDMFKADNFRNVSVEMMTNDEEALENGDIPIKGLEIVGITILGKYINGSCPNANMSIIKFSADEAEQYYNNKSQQSLKQFAEERKEKLKLVSHPMDKSKGAVDMGDWNGDKVKNDLLKEKNFKTLAKSVCLLLEDGWEEKKKGALKYPVMNLKDGKWVYNAEGLSSARAYGEQHDPSVADKAISIQKRLGLYNKEDKEDNMEEKKKFSESESEDKEKDVVMEQSEEKSKEEEKEMAKVEETKKDVVSEDKSMSEDEDTKEEPEDEDKEEVSEDSEIEEEDKDEDKEEEKKFSLDAYVDQSAILAMLENETEERRNLVNQVVKEFSAEEILKKFIEMSKENELLKSEKEFNDNEKKEKKFSAIMASVKEDLDEKTFSELSNEGKELTLDQLGAFENKVKAFAYEATKNKKDNIVKQDNIMMFGGQDSIEQDSMDVFERISKK